MPSNEFLIDSSPLRKAIREARVMEESEARFMNLGNW